MYKVTHTSVFQSAAETGKPNSNVSNNALTSLSSHIYTQIKNSTEYPKTSNSPILPPASSPYTSIHKTYIPAKIVSLLESKVEILPESPVSEGSEKWVEINRREDWYLRADGSTALVLSAIREYESRAPVPVPVVPVQAPIATVVGTIVTAVGTATPPPKQKPSTRLILRNTGQVTREVTGQITRSPRNGDGGDAGYFGYQITSAGSTPAGTAASTAVSTTGSRKGSTAEATPAAQAVALVSQILAPAERDTNWVKEHAKACGDVDFGWPARTQIDHRDMKINSDKTLNENFAILLERCLTDLNKTFFFHTPINEETGVLKQAKNLKFGFSKWLLAQPNLSKTKEYKVKNEEGQNILTLAMLLGKLNSPEGDKALQRLIRNEIVSKLGDTILNSDGTLNTEKLRAAQKEKSRKES